jgi:hypothetical protein
MVAGKGRFAPLWKSIGFAGTNDGQGESSYYITSAPNSEAMATWSENGDTALVQLVGYQNGAAVLAVNNAPSGIWEFCSSAALSATPKANWKPTRNGNYLNPNYAYRPSKMGAFDHPRLAVRDRPRWGSDLSPANSSEKWVGSVTSDMKPSQVLGRTDHRDSARARSGGEDCQGMSLARDQHCDAQQMEANSGGPEVSDASRLTTLEEKNAGLKMLLAKAMLSHSRVISASDPTMPAMPRMGNLPAQIGAEHWRATPCCGSAKCRDVPGSRSTIRGRSGHQPADNLR